MQQQTISVGDAVVFVDVNGDEHDADCTAVWGPNTWTAPAPAPAINLLFFDDSNLRKREETSVPHESMQEGGMHCWRFAK